MDDDDATSHLEDLSTTSNEYYDRVFVAYFNGIRDSSECSGGWSQV